MKKYHCILFIFFAVSGYAQKKTDYGKVKEENKFDCAIHAQGDSALYGVVNICDSKNELEIRLTGIYMPHGNSELIILTFDNQKWDVKKYTYTRQVPASKLEYTSFKTDAENASINKYLFNNLFDTLKQNNIFLLPGQGELPVTRSIHDGALYTLTFKAGNRFRSYSFDNPESYQQEYANIPEFKEYATIVHALKKLFN